MAYKTDIETAQECVMRPIGEIAAKAHIDEKYIEQYGRYKAKIDPALIRESGRGDGKLILVTAIAPKGTTETSSMATRTRLSSFFIAFFILLTS